MPGNESNSSRIRGERLVFTIAVVVLTYVIGHTGARLDWLPSTLLDRAMVQAIRVAQGPTLFLSERVYDWHGVRVHDQAALQPGLTLLTSVWRDSTGHAPGARLITQDGRVVHEWRLNPEEYFEAASIGLSSLADRDPDGSYLLPDGDLLVNIQYVGTVRVDACGRSLWVLPENSHHMIARADDGTFWVPAVSERAHARSDSWPDGYPGLDSPVFTDRLLNVSESGQVLSDISLLDVLYANGLEQYLVKSTQPDPEDLTHLNDIEPLPASLASEYPFFEAGDLLISLRNPNLVLVLDAESGVVRWHLSDPFVQQHDPDFIGDGWIGVFDNRTDPTPRGTMLGGSRIVLVKPASSDQRVIFPTPASDSFYTDIRGKWQYLANGNLLLTEAGPGRVLETSPAGETLWEWVVEPWDEERVPFVSEGTRYDFTEEHVAAWPCSPGETGGME